MVVRSMCKICSMGSLLTQSYLDVYSDYNSRLGVTIPETRSHVNTKILRVFIVSFSIAQIERRLLDTYLYNWHLQKHLMKYSLSKVKLWVSLKLRVIHILKN